jgi:hypothetical protein
MINQNDIDWNAVDEDTQIAAASANAAQTTKKESPMLKPKIGFHYLRWVPAGNALQRKPYLHLVQHPIKVPRDDGTGLIDRFVLCWSYVLNDLVKLGDPNSGGNAEKQKTQSLVSYLGQVQKINQEEFKKYQTFGCPFCKAFNHLNQMGVANDVKNKFYPQEQYFFNVIHRSKQPDGMPGQGDDNVYIWRQAKRNGAALIATVNTMRKQASINYLDVNTGRDIILQAVGEGMLRRYPVCQFMDFPTPMNLGERTVHNLLDLVANSHIDYQKVVNMMKVTHGKLLQENGFIIAGDQAMAQQYQQTEASYQVQQAIAQAQSPSQFAAPTNVVPSPQQVATHPNYPSGIPASDSSPTTANPNIIEINGMAYDKRTGQPLF